MGGWSFSGGVRSRLMTRLGLSLASASVGKRSGGAAGGKGNLTDGGTPPNVVLPRAVLPRARALDWLLGGKVRWEGKVKGGALLAGSGTGGAKETGTPNRVLCADGTCAPIAFPVLGQMCRLARWSCPQ